MKGSARFKRIMKVVPVLLMLALAGCGGEVTLTATVPVPAYTLPGLSGLWFGWAAGGTILTGRVDFSAVSADLDTMVIVVSNDYGREVSRTVTDLRSCAGYVAGTIPFALDTITQTPGWYSFTLFVTDRLGQLSNPVFGTFSL